MCCYTTIYERGTRHNRDIPYDDRSILTRIKPEIRFVARANKRLRNRISGIFRFHSTHCARFQTK